MNPGGAGLGVSHEIGYEIRYHLSKYSHSRVFENEHFDKLIVDCIYSLQGVSGWHQNQNVILLDTPTGNFIGPHQITTG